MSVVWRPSIRAEMVAKRSYLKRAIRAYFYRSNTLEVDLPLLARCTATDPAIASIEVPINDERFYLQTSPEYFAKRLLAAGSEDIFYLGPAFRAAESGRLHNPEFSMLEWYRRGWDHHQLMQEVAKLVSNCCERFKRYPIKIMHYRDVFLQYSNIDIDDMNALSKKVEAMGLISEQLDGDAKLDAIMGLEIGPQLGKEALFFVDEYPASQAALANIENGVAQRFELFIDGIEIANGFNELLDAAEQRRRMNGDNQKRLQQGLDEVPIDEAFLAALDSGLPSCAGVALGLDRLLMIAERCDTLASVMSFDFQRV